MRGFVRHLLLLLALAVGSVQGAAAQESEAGREPPAITVRPSGIEEDARARQERLSRRLQQSDYAMRHICTHCMGPRMPPGASAPFEPLAALAGTPEPKRD